jgi:transcriptional regulator with XRE-family HTH domain
MREKVAENVRALMARRGLKQRHLVELLELSQPAVSQRLNAHQAFDVDELEKIAKAFGVTVADLVGGYAPSGPDGPDGGESVTGRL